MPRRCFIGVIGLIAGVVMLASPFESVRRWPRRRHLADHHQVFEVASAFGIAVHQRNEWRRPEKLTPPAVKESVTTFFDLLPSSAQAVDTATEEQ